LKKYIKVFEQIAINNNTSAAEVEKEISLAILSAIENAEKSEKTALFWGELMQGNEPPTPERVMDTIVKNCLEATLPPR